MKALCLVSLFLMSAVAIAEDSKEDQPKNDLSDRLWLSFEETIFSENAGLTGNNLPVGTTMYHKRDTILAPKFTGGYRFAPSWTLELQLQFGPSESFEATGNGSILYPTASVDSRFLAAVVSKEFALPRKFKVEPKVGVARSWFDHSIGLDETRTNKFTIAETRPFASLGIRRQVTPRMSAGVEISNYFLEQTEPVSTLTFGLRCNF